MFSSELAKCTGFYREIIPVGAMEVFSVLAISLGLAFAITYIFRELFFKKKEHWFVVLFTVGIIGVVVVKVLFPLSNHYAEIPHYSYYDCTFNQLEFSAPFNYHAELLFIVLRLLTIFSLPVLAGLLIAKLIIFLGQISIRLVKKLISHGENRLTKTKAT